MKNCIYVVVISPTYFGLQRRTLIPKECFFYIKYLRGWLTNSLTHPPTHLLTHSTEQSPSWDAGSSWASQEVTHILCSPKVLYCIDNRSPSVSILSSMNPISVPPPHPIPWRSFLIYPPIHAWVFRVSRLPSGYSTKIQYAPLISPYALHARPISWFSIWSPE